MDVVLGLGEGGGVFHQEKQEQDGEIKPLPLKAHHGIGSLFSVAHEPCKPSCNDRQHSTTINGCHQHRHKILMVDSRILLISFDDFLLKVLTKC